MDWQGLKDSIQTVEIKKHERKKSSIIEDCEGYYVMPCSREPFNGDVIKLTGDDFYVLFQRFSLVDEYKFRDRLGRMDEWFYDKPYKVQKNHINYITKWLANETI